MNGSGIPTFCGAIKRICQFSTFFLSRKQPALVVPLYSLMILYTHLSVDLLVFVDYLQYTN